MIGMLNIKLVLSKAEHQNDVQNQIQITFHHYFSSI